MGNYRLKVRWGDADVGKKDVGHARPRSIRKTASARERPGPRSPAFARQSLRPETANFCLIWVGLRAAELEQGGHRVMLKIAAGWPNPVTLD